MPDESCRTCGEILKKYSLCAECKKVTQQICVNCGLKTMEQIHEDCFYNMELIQRTHNFPIFLISHDYVLS